MPAPPLILQTTYAELLERCAAAAFQQEFPDNGAFISKTIKGRRYWYFQAQSEGGRPQKYIGPETADLLDRIARHREARSDERERRALVSTLVRSFGRPRPLPKIGETVAVLAQAGVFRWRSVLIGTVAYQTYSATLGTKLSGAALQTNDIDIDQFLNVSVAVSDHTAPMLDILKQADDTFREVPHTSRGHATSYIGKGNLRVDFLTPNTGPDSATPVRLPALQTDAQPLRFLDFLIHEPEPAVLLHGAGILVQVPAPERYALHKLIIAQRRTLGTAKGTKDLRQAETLLEILAAKRPHELSLVWQEASERGPKWYRLLLEGMTQIAPRTRDVALKAVAVTRDRLPRIDLAFNNSTARYVDDRDIVAFTAEALGSKVACAISREALEDHFGAGERDQKGRLEAFRKNRPAIERMARTKYLSWPIEEPEAVLLTTLDVTKLLRPAKQRRA